MSRWGSAFRLVVAAVVSAFAQNWAILAAQAESERQRRKRDKNNARARAAYNESLKDRLEMVDLTPDMPRSLCLGRVRYVEGVRRRWTSGTNEETLTMLVSFAGHEIDAFESWYIDDVPVTLDGSGYVQESPWRTTANTPAQDTGTLDGSGGLVIVLSYTPVGGTVTANWITGGYESVETGTCSVSMSGATATLTGGRASAPVAVNYERSVATNYVRIRTYLGTDAQNVGDVLDADYPGKITATDKFAGIALTAVDLTYSPDVFPQGPPNITAVFRGAKCYDPRLDSTVAGGSGAHRIATPSTWAWTENPALHALRYAMWGGGFGLTAAQITATTIADVMAAANRCDVSTNFDLLMPDTSTDTVTMVRHRGGFTIPADMDKRAAMDMIVETMAGEWAWDGPDLRIRAGMMGSSVASIDQTWLVESLDGGEADDEPIITASQAISREQRINRVTGKCVDPGERYQLLSYPAISDAALIAAKGEKREEIDYPGANHIAHAQHLASIEIRRRQAGTLVQMQCDARAELLQLFDVVTWDQPDYGITAKTMEVVGVDLPMAPTDLPVGLMLREITAAIYDVDATLDGRDPAPDSSLRAPWDVGTLGALTITSGTTALLDNSIVARAQVSWPAVTGEWVRNGGKVEIQYTRADQALPSADWASWVEEGNSSGAIIPGLLTGRPYLFRGRMVQPMPLVRGPWTATVLHIMAQNSTATGTLGGGNVLRNSSFEVDSNADGLADSWANGVSGTTGTVTLSLGSGLLSGLSQKFSATNLGTTSTDYVYIGQIDVSMASAAGLRVVFSGAHIVSAACSVTFRLVWLTSGGATIRVDDLPVAGSVAAWRRDFMSAVAPATTAKVNALVIVHSKAVAGSIDFNLDGAQLEVGATPTAYAPRADELLAGVVTSSIIAAGAVGTTQIASGGVATGNIAAGAVGTTQIASGAATAASSTTVTASSLSVSGGIVGPVDLNLTGTDITKAADTSVEGVASGFVEVTFKGSGFTSGVKLQYVQIQLVFYNGSNALAFTPQESPNADSYSTAHVELGATVRFPFSLTIQARSQSYAGTLRLSLRQTYVAVSNNLTAFSAIDAVSSASVTGTFSIREYKV